MNESYKLIERRKLPDAKSVGYWYEHIKTGAQIVYLQNSDIDKVFSITFKTPPHDDTGLPHIMEHSVLSGSKNYPVKDPFNELMKGSLVTYLNAGTYQDKTMYPIATYNHTEYLNLMRVYLDSVFFPKIYERKQSFMQEGWHYELENIDSELKINGIVYSEMKGALSDPLDYLDGKINQALFPDNCNRFNSGGDPEFIPSLSYENYLDFHRNYYHPSNSIVFFYGDLNIDPALKILDEEYLSAFEKKEVDGSVAIQKPFDEPKVCELNYPVLECEEDGKNILVAGYVAGTVTDSYTCAYLKLISSMLMEYDASPLKRALLAAEIGEDVSAFFNDHQLQPYLNITVQNSAHSAVKLREIINATLKDIVENGIDKTLANACLNKAEFAYREQDGRFSAGHFYNTEMLALLRYDKNPLDMYVRLDAIKNMRAKLNDGIIEQLIQKHLLDNNHAVFVTARPKTGINEAKEEKLKKELKAFKESLSHGELQKIADEFKTLREFQNRSDSKEDLAKIPRVELKDISKSSENIPLAVHEISGVKLLYSELATNGIVYSSILFDTNVVPDEKLGLAALTHLLVSKLDTKKHSYADMSNEINTNLGGFLHSYMSENTGDGGYKIMFGYDTKALEGNMPKIFEIAAELFKETSFDDKRRIKEVLAEIKLKLEQMIQNGGDVFASVKSGAHLFEGLNVYDRLSGIAFYEYINSVYVNFDRDFEKLKAGLNEMYGLMFGRSSLVLTLACEKNMFKAALDELERFTDALTGTVIDPVKRSLLKEPVNEAFITSSQVQYNAAAYNYRTKHDSYSGAMDVFSRITEDDYLMSELRAKGGAYGYGARITQNGAIRLSSYRDPRLAESYGVYKRAPENMAGLELNEDDMKKYIIGTVNQKDKPLKPFAAHGTAVKRYFAGKTPEDIQKERDEILSCVAEDIRKIAGIFSGCLETEVKCTIGSDAKINANKDMFDKITKFGF